MPAHNHPGMTVFTYGFNFIVSSDWIIYRYSFQWTIPTRSIRMENRKIIYGDLHVRAYEIDHSSTKRYLQTF